jgi:ATP-dependent DNA ligase
MNTMKPQLLSEANKADVDFLLSSPDYALSQKFDGVRLIIAKDGASISGYNRSGELCPVPLWLVKVLSSTNGHFVIDGELLKNKYYVFDLLEMDHRDFTKSPWSLRATLLNALQNKVDIFIVPQYEDKASKRAFYIACVQQNSEGVVFTHRDGFYLQGKRNRRNFKYKFKKNSCVVEVGKVSSQTGDGKTRTFAENDVVKVNLLYVSDSNKLVQPTKPRIRTDKSWTDCTTTQLDPLKTNKGLVQFYDYGLTSHDR